MSFRPYHLHLPKDLTSCVVFASPHSGRAYPASFVSGTELDSHMIRSSEDAYVDLLFDTVPLHGAPLMTAGAPRAYVDLNRSEDELDPALIEGVRKQGHNPRVASGLGVIPRVVAQGRAIYRGKLPMQVAQGRLDAIWHPYHAQLKRLLRRAHDTHGQAILLDCHSMPRDALPVPRHGRRAEIVIGDRFGVSASAQVVEQVEAAFRRAGFQVARNAPFAGAYIVQSYGRPSRRQHAIQIEIDRSLYMNEETITPHAGFAQVKAQLAQVIGELATLGTGQGQALAAE